MANRIEKEVLYLRHNFTPEERLKMGDDLAAAYNRQESIDNEEAVFKAQFKERRATIDQAVTSLSRSLANQFEMRNIECRLEWDHPNVNEVQYVRVDTGEIVKTRPFTESERQQDLPLDQDKSEQNVAEFFGLAKAAAVDEPEGEFEAPLVNEVPDGIVVADGPPEPVAKPVKELTEKQKIAQAKKNLDDF